MAGIYLYRCPECDFRVESGGPSSRGFAYWSKCFKCEDCGWIGDIHTSINNSESEDWAGSTRKKCRKCYGSNVQEWDFKCPIHEVDMIRANEAHIFQD